MGDFTITLEAARRNRHMSQTEAAKALRVAKSTLSRWERDETKVPTPAAIALAEIYQTPRELLACLNHTL